MKTVPVYSGSLRQTVTTLVLVFISYLDNNLSRNLGEEFACLTMYRSFGGIPKLTTGTIVECSLGNEKTQCQYYLLLIPIEGSVSIQRFHETLF